MRLLCRLKKEPMARNLPEGYEQVNPKEFDGLRGAVLTSECHRRGKEGISESTFFSAVVDERLAPLVEHVKNMARPDLDERYHEEEG